MYLFIVSQGYQPSGAYMSSGVPQGYSLTDQAGPLCSLPPAVNSAATNQQAQPPYIRWYKDVLLGSPILSLH